MSGIAVTVVYAAPDIEASVAVELAPGATLADAVAASGLCAGHGLAPPAIAFAIFGQRASPDTPLIDGDRVEITRALRISAQAARRDRAAAHPLKKAGRPPPR